MHTWWGKEGAGAPLRRDGVVVADLKSGQAIPPADAFKPMGKSLADQPIGGGGSYVAGGGAKRGGGGGGGGPAVRRGPGP